MLGIDPPKFLACSLNFEVPISPARISSPVQCKTGLHHFSRQVSSVSEMANGNGSLVRAAAISGRSNDLPTAKSHQNTFGYLAIGMVEFRCIDTCKTDAGLVDHNGIAVDHPAVAFNCVVT